MQATLGIANLVLAIVVASHSGAFAQAKQQQMAPPAKQAPAPAATPQAAPAPELKQIALTDKQIEGVLSAQKDMDAITDKIPDNAPPDPKLDAKGHVTIPFPLLPADPPKASKAPATRSASSRSSCHRRPTIPTFVCATSVFRCATCAP